jgi:hypothetical protein
VLFRSGKRSRLHRRVWRSVARNQRLKTAKLLNERRGAAGCGERGEATGAGAQDLICRATGGHRNATGAQPVQLALIPIEQVVDPNRQRLNVTIGGGDNVTANEWRSNWHRKA